VERYEKEGVGAILVGETLMRAGKNVDKCVQMLLGTEQPTSATSATSTSNTLVKICGTRTIEAAKAAVESGADLIGIILVPNTKRTVDFSTALSISHAVHSTYKPGVDPASLPYPTPSSSCGAHDWFTHSNSFLSHPTRALLVGVFRDQPLPEILHLQRMLDLDIIQLHGSEPLEWARMLPCPVIKKFSPGQISLIATQAYHAGALLDSGAGGTGCMLDLGDVSHLISGIVGNGAAGILLAGGLDEGNVLGALEKVRADGKGVMGVDVSSGVETGGQHDLEKIRRFVRTVKGSGGL